MLDRRREDLARLVEIVPAWSMWSTLEPSFVHVSTL